MPKRIEIKDELKIIEDVENDKYHSLEGNELDSMLTMLNTASDNTIEKLTKKKAINIRLLESDIIRLKSMALNEGMPYQTYISHMIHKLTTGALKIHGDNIEKVKKKIKDEVLIRTSKGQMSGIAGTLWEGIFKSSLIDTKGYFFTVSCYIELNAVRASMVTKPEEYPWSSSQQNAMGKHIKVIVPHASYLSLGNNDLERQVAYRLLFKDQISDVKLKNSGCN